MVMDKVASLKERKRGSRKRKKSIAVQRRHLQKFIYSDSIRLQASFDREDKS